MGRAERARDFRRLLDRTETLVVERDNTTAAAKRNADATENAFARGDGADVTGDLDRVLRAGDADRAVLYQQITGMGDPPDDVSREDVEQLLADRSSGAAERPAIVDGDGGVRVAPPAGAGTLGTQWREARAHPEPPEFETEAPHEAFDAGVFVWASSAGAETPTQERLRVAIQRTRDAQLATQVNERTDRAVGGVAGSGHAVPRLVDAPVEPVNELPSDIDWPRYVTRNALRGTDGIGYALRGDPERVADDLGPDVVRAQLAGLGADLRTSPRTRNDGFPETYAAAIGETVDDDRSPAEQVEQLQSAAREALETVVDLDAAEEYGDLDPSRPADQPETVADVVVGLLPDDATETRRAGVETLLDEGVVDVGSAEQLASLKNVAYGAELSEGGAVDPFGYDPADARDDFAREALNARELVVEAAERGTEADLDDPNEGRRAGNDDGVDTPADRDAEPTDAPADRTGASTGDDRSVVATARSRLGRVADGLRHGAGTVRAFVTRAVGRRDGPERPGEPAEPSGSHDTPDAPAESRGEDTDRTTAETLGSELGDGTDLAADVSTLVGDATVTETTASALRRVAGDRLVDRFEAEVGGRGGEANDLDPDEQTVGGSTDVTL